MTKKEHTIKACRELAAKYRKPEGREFFYDEVCPLCIIHRNCISWAGDCSGCPLAGECGGIGCFDFSSCETARAAAEESMGNDQKMVREKHLKIITPAFDARAAFFDKIIPILEGIPAERFTKRGWEYFDMLNRSW